MSDFYPAALPGMNPLPGQDEEERRKATAQKYGLPETNPGREAQVQEQGYRLPVSDAQNRYINTMTAAAAEKGEDPEEARYKLAAAVHYSRLYKMPVENILAGDNFDIINKNYLQKTGGTAKSNWEAIVSAWDAGSKTMEFNKLANAWKASGGQDGSLELQADQMYAEMDKMRDNLPRPWYIDLIKAGAESMPFTLDVMAASLAGTAAGTAGAITAAALAGVTIGTGGLGAIPIALVAAAGGAGGMAVGLDRSAKDQEGIEYYRLRKLGVEHDIASPVSSIGANLLGLTEVALGTIPHFAGAVAGKAAAKTLIGRIMTKAGVQNLLGPIARAAVGYVGQGIEEGMEEAVQQMISNLSDIIATEAQGEGADVQPATIRRVLEGTGENFKQGVMASIMLGLPGTMISWRGNVEEARAVNNMAANLELEDFIRFAKKDEPSFIKGLGEADQNIILEKVWQSQQARQARSAKKAEPAMTTDQQMDKAETVDQSQGKGDGKVVRLDTGRLYTSEETTLGETREGQTEGRMLVGDPTAGSGKRYGYIDFTETSEGITINDVKVTEGFQPVRRDMLLEFAAKHPGVSIAWNPKAKSMQDLKQNIIKANPRGEDAGMQWFDTDADVGELIRISDIKRKLTETAPQIRPELQEGFISLVTPIAKASGQTLDQFMGNVFADEMFTNDPSKVSAAQGKRGGTAFKQLEGKFKALVYLTETSDFTTLSHEFMHAIEPHMTEADRTVIKEVFGENKEGMAEAWEKYLYSGEAPTQELQSLFQKVAAWFREVYKKISGATEVDPRIKQVFEKLFTGGAFTFEQAAAQTDSQNAKDAERKKVAEVQASKPFKAADALVGKPIRMAMAAMDKAGLDIEELQEIHKNVYNAANVFVSKGSAFNEQSFNAGVLLDKLLQIIPEANRPQEVRDLLNRLAIAADAQELQGTSPALFIDLTRPINESIAQEGEGELLYQDSLKEQMKEQRRKNLEHERTVVNPIDLNASPEEKTLQLEALSAENEVVLKKLIKKIDDKLGTESKTSYKEHDKILSKASRPIILEEKPWHGVEHIRDSFRFKTIINNLSDIVEAMKIIMAEDGIYPIKIDTGKMFVPKEWGWRFVSFDLRMPNGQLVEYYLPMVELERVKKTNHLIFEKWRNTEASERIERAIEYEQDLDLSYSTYLEGWNESLNRQGLEDESAARASWEILEAELVSVMRTKLSLRSSAEADPTAQTPSLRTAENPLSSTNALPDSGTTETIISASNESVADTELESNTLFLYQEEAWHGGSRTHSKFSTEYIGQGEGHAAFGWGLYFTQLIDVAKSYAEAITRRRLGELSTEELFKDAPEIAKRLTRYEYELQISIVNKIRSAEAKETAIYNLRALVEMKQYEASRNRQRAEDSLAVETGLYDKTKVIAAAERDEQAAARVLDVISDIENSKITFPLAKRALYKVRLFSNKTEGQDYKWLDWYEPIDQADFQRMKKTVEEKEISSMEAARNAESKVTRDWMTEQSVMWAGYGIAFDNIESRYGEDATVEDVYNGLAQRHGKKEASLFLLSQGFDGIRYPVGSLGGGYTPSLKTQREGLLQSLMDYFDDTEYTTTFNRTGFKNSIMQFAEQKKFLEARAYINMELEDNAKRAKIQEALSAYEEKTNEPEPSNYVIFDDSQIEIEEHILYQSGVEQVSPNLIAYHNVRVAGIKEILRVGGIAMPSLAILKKGMDYSNFGDVSLIAPKDLIDPKKSTKNKVFDADVYSPRQPRPVYDIDYNELKAIVEPMMPVIQEAYKTSSDTYYNNQAPHISTVIHNIISSLEEGNIEYAGGRELKAYYLTAIEGKDEGINESPNDGDAFKKWLVTTFSPLMNNPKIFKGFTDAGNRRYVPYNLENVYKAMRAEGIRGGESFSYGLPNVRAQVATQFKSLAQMRKAADRIVDEETFEKAKEEIGVLFDEILAEAVEGYTQETHFNTYDTFVEVLIDGIKRRDIKGELEEFSFTPTDSLLSKISLLLDTLSGFPTTYFEAKLDRIVYANEFAAAVLPSDVDPDVLIELGKQGIFTETYKPGDKDSRTAAIDRVINDKGIQEKILFQSSPAMISEAQETIVTERERNNKTVQKFIDQAAKKEEPSGFYKTIITNAKKRAQKTEAIFQHIIDGHNLFRDSDNHLAVIHKSSREDYKWQMSFFDARGPYSHESRNTLKEFVDTLIQAGFSPDYSDRIAFQSDPLGELMLKDGRKQLVESAENVHLPGEDLLFQAIDSPDFKKWFGASKVVDENGQPLVVYHGTTEEFDAFSKERIGVASGNKGFLGEGFYFTKNREMAAAYGKVLSVYLRISNPFVIEGVLSEETADLLNEISGAYAFEEGQSSIDVYNGLSFGVVEAPEMATELTANFMAYGYDGVILESEDRSEIVAFNPNQVKSVMNHGTWNVDDDRMLYQSDTELMNESKDFESWQEWRDYHEVMTPEEDMSPEERAGDNAFYKKMWEQARKPQPEAFTPDALDNQFIEDMADLGLMTEFLSEMGYYIEGSESYQPADAEEQAELERMIDVAQDIQKQVHTTVELNSLKARRGGEITSRARKQMLTLMKQAPRAYRALYSRVMQNEKYAVPEGEETILPDIEKVPEAKTARMSITQRLALAREMQNADIAKRLKSGDIVVDEELQQYLDSLKEERKGLEKKIETLEESVKRGNQVIRYGDKRAAAMQADLKAAEKTHRDLEKKVKALEERGQKLSQKLVDERDKAKQRYDDTVSNLKRKAAGRAIIDKLLKEREIAELKYEIREKEKERRRLEKVRQYKQRLAKRIMKKPSNSIAWDQRAVILDLQSRFDPNFRKMKPGEEGVIEGIRAALAEDREYEGLMTPRLMDMAAKRNLSNMSLDEIETLANFIDSIARYGRLRRQIWKFQRDEATLSAREAIVQAIEQSGKYVEPPAFGSAEEEKQRRGAKSFIRSVDYAFINLERKAIMLDNGKEGENHKWLIQEERKHRADKLRIIRERQEPILNHMKQIGMKVSDLYATHTISGIGPGAGTATYTTSDLLYAIAGSKNERSRAAIAYGNLVSAEEKKNMSLEEVIETGDARLQKLLQYAEGAISQGEREILALIEADYSGDNYDRLNNAAIEEFNIPIERQHNYVPIKRREMTYDDLAGAIADDLLDMNAGSMQRLPGKGFTKSRINIKANHQKPTEMDLFGGWNKAVETQEHFIHYTGYLREVNGIYKRTADKQNLRGMIVGSYGHEMMDSIDDALTETANPSAFIQRDSASRFLRGLRGDLGSAYLGWKLSSIVTQVITSPMPFLGYVNPLHLSATYLRVMSNPVKAWENVSGLSDIMRTRSIDPIFEAIKQGIKDSPEKKMLKIKSLGMKGMEWADRISVMAGWIALYEQEYGKNGGDEEGAVAYADKIVLKTQPSGQAQDLAPAFKTKQEAWRVFLQFQSQLNIIWQNVRFDLPTAMKNKEYGRALGIAYSYMVAGALLGLAKEGFKDDDEDRDKALNMLYWSMTQFSDSVPLLGSAFSSVMKGAITGEQDMMWSSKLYPAADTMIAGFKKLTQKDYAKAVENFGYSFGYFSGLPVSGYKDIKRAWDSDSAGEAFGKIIGRRD